MHPCNCGGMFIVYDTKTIGARRTRHLKCDQCGDTDKQHGAVDAKGRFRPNSKSVPTVSSHIIESAEMPRIFRA